MGLGDDAASMSWMTPESRLGPKDHREHIKYEIIKYAPPTKKPSSSVSGLFSFHWDLWEGILDKAVHFPEKI